MGTEAWRNWRGFVAGKAETEFVVDDLQSDRDFIGSAVQAGPHKFSIVYSGRLPRQNVGSAVRLGFGIHEYLFPDVVVDGELAKPDSDAYHGGSIGDEVAALVSLILGVRLRSAGTVELSGIHNSTQPSEPMHFDAPTLLRPGPPGTEYIPAARTREPNLRHLQRLQTFPTIDEASQTQLVRAARAYASALRWVNEDPNQAWLQLVTAAEIGANRRQSATATPAELVETLWPELWAALATADETTKVAVCKQVAGLMRATRKFIDFIEQCAPPPVEPRPTWGAIDWIEMANHARLIYKHRSHALHSGRPFPMPMPMLQQAVTSENGTVEEGFAALNAGGMGGIWGAEEIPMLLPTFEHIVRGALLKWWDEIAILKWPPTAS